MSKPKKELNPKERQIKSFCYVPDDEPDIHKWFTDLENDKIPYSERLRELIRGDNSEHIRLANEITAIRKQIGVLEKRGVKIVQEPENSNNNLVPEPEIIAEPETAIENEQPEIKLSQRFLKNRYGL